MKGTLKGEGIVAAAFDFAFGGRINGIRGGQRFVRGINESLRANVPLLCSQPVAALNGVVVFLVPMTKTSAALIIWLRRGYPNFFYDGPYYGRRFRQFSDVGRYQCR
jgi:acetyl-CoA carboxylase carboxyl transferase subunit beta